MSKSDRLERRVKNFEYGYFSQAEFEKHLNFIMRNGGLETIKPLTKNQFDVLLLEGLDFKETYFIGCKGMFYPQTQKNPINKVRVNPIYHSSEFDKQITIVHEMIHFRETNHFFRENFPGVSEYLTDITAFVSLDQDPQLVDYMLSHFKKKSSYSYKLI